MLADLTLTARGEEAIERLAARLRDWLLEHLEGVQPSDADAVAQAISQVVRRAVIERAESREPMPVTLA